LKDFIELVDYDWLSEALPIGSKRLVSQRFCEFWILNKFYHPGGQSMCVTSRYKKTGLPIDYEFSEATGHRGYRGQGVSAWFNRG